MYAGDEFYDDDITSGPVEPDRTAVPARDDRLTNAQILRSLDGLTPLFNANGPNGAHPGRVFSGWDVPDWLMQNIRAALRDGDLS